VSTVVTGGCDKCHGDLFLEQDEDGRHWDCLQCGHSVKEKPEMTMKEQAPPVLDLKVIPREKEKGTGVYVRGPRWYARQEILQKQKGATLAKKIAAKAEKKRLRDDKKAGKVLPPQLEVIPESPDYWRGYRQGVLDSRPLLRVDSSECLKRETLRFRFESAFRIG